MTTSFRFGYILRKFCLSTEDLEHQQLLFYYMITNDMPPISYHNKIGGNLCQNSLTKKKQGTSGNPQKEN